MSDDEEKPNYDRMSIGSLKRELEAQQAGRASARDEALERIRQDTSGKKIPWRTLGILTAGGLGLMVVAVLVVRSSFPETAEWVLPHFVLPLRDAGPPIVFAAPAHDAGPSDGGAHHAGHPHVRHDAGGRREDLDLGEGPDDDPIGGI